MCCWCVKDTTFYMPAEQVMWKMAHWGFHCTNSNMHITVSNTTARVRVRARASSLASRGCSCSSTRNTFEQIELIFFLFSSFSSCKPCKNLQALHPMRQGQPVSQCCCLFKTCSVEFFWTADHVPYWEPLLLFMTIYQCLFLLFMSAVYIHASRLAEDVTKFGHFWVINCTK